jgi:hypothetical protein
MGSSYWEPIIYHLGVDGRFIALNMTGSSVYWDLYASEQELVPLPDDFNMVIGNVTNVNGTCSGGHGLGFLWRFWKFLHYSSNIHLNSWNTHYIP